MAATKSNLAKYQRFEIATVNRQQILGAPYNPRKADAATLERLRKSLKANGLVEPLVWNKRTGNLVGGHQRISQLDILEGRDDYDLTVSVVDLDLEREKELNIALNNRSIQGEYDDTALAELIASFDKPNKAALGMTDGDLDFLLNETSGLRTLVEDSPERAKTKDILEDIKQDRKQMGERLRAENDANFYTVVVFEDQAERAAFHERLGAPVAETYLRGSDILAVIAGE